VVETVADLTFVASAMRMTGSEESFARGGVCVACWVIETGGDDHVFSVFPVSDRTRRSRVSCATATPAMPGAVKQKISSLEIEREKSRISNDVSGQNIRREGNPEGRSGFYYRVGAAADQIYEVVV
jgi:hypothetical protein